MSFSHHFHFDHVQGKKKADNISIPSIIVTQVFGREFYKVITCVHSVAQKKNRNDSE